MPATIFRPDGQGPGPTVSASNPFQLPRSCRTLSKRSSCLIEQFEPRVTCHQDDLSHWTDIDPLSRIFAFRTESAVVLTSINLLGELLAVEGKLDDLGSLVLRRFKLPLRDSVLRSHD